MYRTFVLLFIFLSSSLFSQKAIYQTNRYTIFSDKVVEGKNSAIFHSRNKIASNYSDLLNTGVNRKIKFKFALNGKDNERAPGKDHIIELKQGFNSLVTDTFYFGREERAGKPIYKEDNSIEKGKYRVEFILNARKIDEQLAKGESFNSFDGTIITKDQLVGYFIAGDLWPLTWDFSNLINRKDLQLTSMGTGIYKLVLDFEYKPYREYNQDGFMYWNLTKDISRFPRLTAPYLIMEGMYDLSLEELLQSVRPDNTFMAGEKWDGVWTRDVSYSILLSLAILEPELAINSLKAKVDNKRIIQDTGTGGSWPVSTDRLTWALAANEIYLVTGDKAWLKYAYEIIKNSVETDKSIVRNPETGLMYGETSFIDWREQSYPKWMDSKDIFRSQAIGTNAVHYKTLDILVSMAKDLDEDYSEYEGRKKELKGNINKYLWLADKEYYGEFIYGRTYQSISSRSETLGEALAILFGIADKEKSKKIVENTPIAEYGVPCFYPQIPDIGPYHNNGIWPFVVAYWGWASAVTGNEIVLENSISTIYRAASLFLTNKENMVCQTGSFYGTAINSNRQLWSVAGNLAIIYRMIFGLSIENNGMRIAPFIPESFKGDYNLNDFPYRSAKLDISISGHGNIITSFKLDGKESENNFIPDNLSGKHKIEIRLTSSGKKGEGNFKLNKFSPSDPIVELNENILSWNREEGILHYNIYRNGEKIASTEENRFRIEENSGYMEEYQVEAVDIKGDPSFLSEPITIDGKVNYTVIPEELKARDNKEYIESTLSENSSITFNVNVSEEGLYGVKFLYANGTGPINTDNNCGIRTLVVNDNPMLAVIFPQRGTDKWDDYGYTNTLLVSLKKGNNKLELIYRAENKNMDGEINRFRLKNLRMDLLDK